MVENVKITITPSTSDSDLLTVSDAMQQVMDIITLLSAAENAKNKDTRIVWKLSKASMNSPFNIEASAYGDDPSIAMDMIAMETKRTFFGGMESIISGENAAPEWTIPVEGIFKKIFKRNLNGIGKTNVDLGQDINPISITHRTAGKAVIALEKIALERAEKIEDLTHSAFGSLEGVIIKTDTHYGKPSFMIQERLSNNVVRCTVLADVMDRIGLEHNFSEVWQNKRVLVEGAISYNSKGYVANVNVTDMKTISPTHIPVEAFINPHFTNGLTPAEYLDRFREGKLD